MLGALRSVVTTLVACCVTAAAQAGAQEMEPKAYSASPVGANFLLVGYSAAAGSVLFDPSLPVTDVHADVQGLAFGAGHTFSMFGALGLMSVVVPVAWVDATGQVLEQAAEVKRTGFADMRLKLSVNLWGNPAMTPREFAKAPRRTVVGVSVSATAPSGQYDGTKLVNIGTNRWSFKPEVGVSWPVGKFDIDAYLGAWFFAANDNFFPGGLSRTQDPMVAGQGHASYTFRPRLWIAADATWYRGGSTQVSAGAPTIPLNNSRLGLTVSLPVGDRYSFKVGYSNGVTVRTGTDFSQIAVAWQVLWLSPRWSGR